MNVHIRQPTCTIGAATSVNVKRQSHATSSKITLCSVINSTGSQSVVQLIVRNDGAWDVDVDDVDALSSMFPCASCSSPRFERERSKFALRADDDNVDDDDDAELDAA